MKKILVTFASLAIVVGLVGSAEAGATALKTAQSTKAPPAVSAHTRDAMLSKLGSKRLSARQLKVLGLKALPRQQVTRIKQLEKSSGAARAATAGSVYWYTYHYYGYIWVDRYYSGPYYGYPWYPYYAIYDNYKVCTTGGTGCYAANVYTYSYYLYYYPLSTWYWYGPSGYTTAYGGGAGPFSG